MITITITTSKLKIWNFAHGLNLMAEHIQSKKTFEGRTFFDWRQPLMEDSIWGKMPFDGRQSLMEDMVWKHPLMEDDLWWKKVYDLWWKISFDGGQPFTEDHLLKTFDGRLPFRLDERKSKLSTFLTYWIKGLLFVFLSDQYLEKSHCLSVRPVCIYKYIAHGGTIRSISIKFESSSFSAIFVCKWFFYYS